MTGVNPQALAMWEVLRKAIWKWGMLTPGGDERAERMIKVGNAGLRLGPARKRNAQTYGG
jgi:hypothetical protein